MIISSVIQVLGAFSTGIWLFATSARVIYVYLLVLNISSRGARYTTKQKNETIHFLTFCSIAQLFSFHIKQQSMSGSNSSSAKNNVSTNETSIDLKNIERGTERTERTTERTDKTDDM